MQALCYVSFRSCWFTSLIFFSNIMWTFFARQYLLLYKESFLYASNLVDVHLTKVYTAQFHT